MRIKISKNNVICVRFHLFRKLHQTYQELMYCMGPILIITMGNIAHPSNNHKKNSELWRDFTIVHSSEIKNISFSCKCISECL